MADSLVAPSDSPAGSRPEGAERRASAILAPEAIDLICGFEGYHKRLPDGRAAPYLCPAYVPTIGYGSIWRADGTRVTMADVPITREEAAHLMSREIAAQCVPAVNRLIVPRLHPLSHGALVSFTYNLGSGALKASGLRKAVNDRRWADVPGELAKWRVASGRVLPGLIRRREAEAYMFMSGVAKQRAAGDDQGTSVDELARWVATVRRAA